MSGSAWHTRHGRITTSFFRGGISILTIASFAVMIGCAGVSTSSRTPPDPGTGASTHTVDLSWMASTSNDVSGYNVYRGVHKFVRIVLTDQPGACRKHVVYRFSS